MQNALKIVKDTKGSNLPKGKCKGRIFTTVALKSTHPEIVLKIV